MRPTIQLALGAILLLPPALAAQGTVADEGILLVARGSAPASREAFRVVRGSNGSTYYTLTATISSGALRASPKLSADDHGIPLLYQTEVKDGGSTERIQASGRPGRLSAVFRRSDGESAREYILGSRALVLDEDVFHQYLLVPLAGPGMVTLVVPRRSAQLSARIEKQGTETITIDGQPVEATRWSVVAPDGTRHLWVDGSGRLLRVAAGGTVATREELPR